MLNDKRFKHIGETHLGLVVFKLNIDARTSVSNQLNAELLARLNKSGEIHMIPTTFHKEYVIRFCVTNEYASNDDIGNPKLNKYFFLQNSEHMCIKFILFTDTAWEIIQRFANETLRDYEEGKLKFQANASARSLIRLPTAPPEHRHFAFVRSIPRNLYNKHGLDNALKDGSTPVLMVDDDEF